MKHLIILFVLCSFCSFEIQAQNTESKIRKFEAEVFEKGEDTKALELILMCSEAKSVFTKHKAIVMATYDAEMNKFEKSQKFKKETVDSKEVQEMISEIELTTQAKQEYLKSQYPSYLSLLNQSNRKKNPKRLQKHMNQKVPAQPIGRGK